jgi:hypothetical protein
MNKIGVVAAAGVAIVLGTVGLAQAASGGTAATGGRRVIHVTARSTQEVVVPGPAAESMVGARFVGADDLFRGSRRVGHDGRDCVAVVEHEDESADFQCVATLALADGLITAQSLSTFTEDGEDDLEFAITGGTGAYRNAEGTIAVDRVSDTESRYTIDLR